jgi:hypothetical protein
VKSNSIGILKFLSFFSGKRVFNGKFSARFKHLKGSEALEAQDWSGLGSLGFLSFFRERERTCKIGWVFEMGVWETGNCCGGEKFNVRIAESVLEISK